MKSFRYFLYIVLSLLEFESGFAQKPPEWKDGYRKVLANSTLEVVSGEGQNIEEAQNMAVQDIIRRKGISVGQWVDITINNGSISVKGSKELLVKANIIDRYLEYNGEVCRLYMLVQILKNPSPETDTIPVHFSNEYPFSARVFVPGMAQIHKGQTGKGIGFITGEIAFIGGIVASECLRQSYDAKVLSTHNNLLRKDYADKANICMISRNIAIAGAAALYIWNIIDGAVAKGKTHIVIGDAQLLFAPYVSSETGGLALSVKF